MRANTDRIPGVQLITDGAGHKVYTSAPEPPDDFPSIPEDHEDRDLVALAGRVNTGIAVQLLLDRATGETFVTTVVAGSCLTVAVEGEIALDAYRHPGFYGLLPQLDK